MFRKAEITQLRPDYWALTVWYSGQAAPSYQTYCNSTTPDPLHVILRMLLDDELGGGQHAQN